MPMHTLDEMQAELARRGRIIERQQKQIVTLASEWDRMRSALEQLHRVFKDNSSSPDETEQILAQVQAALTPSW